MINKRGQWTFERLPRLILLVLVFIILILVSVKLGVFVKEESLIEKCRLSVLANSKVHESTEASGVALIVRKDLPIQCPAVKTELTGTLDQQMNQVAEELRNCWYKMGESQLKVFGTDFIETQELPTCLVCSEFKSLESIDTFQFKKYLKDTKISGKDLTYGDYIGTQNLMTILPPKSIEKQGGINSGNNYFIIFQRTPSTHAKNNLNLVLGDSVKEVQNMRIILKQNLADSKICEQLFWQRAE